MAPQRKQLPIHSAYSDALQHPRLAFRSKTLKTCTIERNAKNLPLGRAGNYASVYKGTLPSGEARAIRVFTRYLEGTEERYREIGQHLQLQSLEWLVGFSYTKEGIYAKCNGVTEVFPLVTMDWVAGQSLFEWAHERALANDGKAFREIADQWARMIDDLERHHISHCDLQDKNILVTGSQQLRLVDYDDMCVPALVGMPTQGVGVKPYQHPERGDDTLLSLDIDRFSALFIYVALRALAEDARRLWRQYVIDRNYDKLLIQKEDLDTPASGIVAHLRALPNPEIGRVVDELVEAWRGAMKDAPRLNEVLFSYKRVQSFCDAGKWDEAVDVLDEFPESRNKAPADMVASIAEADERVECRRKLAWLVQRGDEAGMKDCYDNNRRLLDDYEAAAADVALARQAATVVPLLDKLDSEENNANWITFVDIWNGHSHVLQGRVSTTRYQTLASEWEPRNKALKALENALRWTPLDLAAVKQASTSLNALGGHPAAVQYEADVATLVACADVWPNVEKALHAADKIPYGYQRDKDLLKMWDAKRQDLEAWPKSLAEKPTVDKARHRFHKVDEFDRQAQSAAQSCKRKELAKAAALARRIPDKYEHPHNGRASEVRSQDAALTQLMLKLGRQTSDDELIGAWLGVKAVAADPFVNQPLRDRLLAYEGLARIYRQLPPQEFHSHLLNAWKPCLDDWSVAEDWKKLYERELLRKQMLDRLGNAISMDNDAEAIKASMHELLCDYPLPATWLCFLADARERAKAADDLVSAIQAGDTVWFRRSFDVDVLSRHSGRFASVHQQLVELTVSEFGKPVQLGMKRPLGREAVSAINPQTRKARWHWPEKRFSRRCDLGLCRSRPHNGLRPTDGVILRLIPVTNDAYEAGSGVVFDCGPGLVGCHVVVWSVIDLGFTTLHSDPLYLGKA